MRPVTSVASWGERRQGDNYLRLNGAIGVSVSESGLVRVATLYCHPKDRFTKKFADKVLRKRLEVESADTLVWQGQVTDAARQRDTAIKDIVTPFTEAFYLGLVESLSVIGVDRSKGGERMIFGRSFHTYSRKVDRRVLETAISLGEAKHLYPLPIPRVAGEGPR